MRSRKSFQLTPEERAKLREIVKEEKTCERCGEDAATHLFYGDALCEDCHKRAKSLDDAERRAAGRQIDYAELALGVEERDAELANLRADLEQARHDLSCVKDDRDLWRDAACDAKDTGAKMESSRETIRRLVVAARAINRTMWQALDQYEINDRGIVRDMRQHVIGLNIEHALRQQEG